MNWTKEHGKIFSTLIAELVKANIRYFILRNYEELPNGNSAKDVDILIEPSRINDANNIIQDVFKRCQLTHQSLARFIQLYCWHGMDVNNHLSIHIDLIGGYRVKGYEVFTFDELYEHTIEYNGLKVLDRYYEALMVFIYKQFGYKKPKLKQDYKDIIYNTLENFPEFSSDLQKLLGKSLTTEIIKCISQKDFDKMLTYTKDVTSKLKWYSFRKAPMKVAYRVLDVFWQKFYTIIIKRQINGRSFALIAPDGAGKTTFLDALLKETAFYYVAEPSLFHLFHFRPEILPNLGAVGEKAGIAKQDKNFTTPHRAKPAGFISSVVRITYYWIDYVIGWFLYTTRDIQYDRITVFDRYSYDMLVDPHRTRLGLPYWLRKMFVSFMPHPKFTFYLDVEPEEIYRRKQELSPNEINRQVAEYHKLVKTSNRFITLNGNRRVEEITRDAIVVVLDTFCKRIKD